MLPSSRSALRAAESSRAGNAPSPGGAPPVRWEVGFAIRAGVPLSAPAQLLVQAIQASFGDGPVLDR